MEGGNGGCWYCRPNVEASITLVEPAEERFKVEIEDAGAKCIALDSATFDFNWVGEVHGALVYKNSGGNIRV